MIGKFFRISAAVGFVWHFNLARGVGWHGRGQARPGGPGHPRLRATPAGIRAEAASPGLAQPDTLTDFRDTRPISARDASSEDTRTGTRVPRQQRQPSPIRRVCGETRANSISDYRNFLKPGRGGMELL
jgi:hypothetical protein